MNSFCGKSEEPINATSAHDQKSVKRTKQSYGYGGRGLFSMKANCKSGSLGKNPQSSLFYSKKTPGDRCPW